MTWKSSPAKYAKSTLYIGNASTIRQRVIEWFGTAPPVSRIERWLADYQTPKHSPQLYRMESSHSWTCDHPRNDDTVQLSPNGSMFCKICRGAK